MSDITNETFPVVGVGASAGGLEALSEFFAAMPDSPGAAFVVVQHLSPNFKSLMDELLSRVTDLPIQIVHDGVEVEKDHIYLIPPKMNMTIFHRKLLLQENRRSNHLNLPIDIFFRSLAKDLEKDAVGIILSGTGSDGTLGIRAIKSSGGIAMVQDSHSSKFDGMPNSSIATGIVDVILPPAELARRMVEYLQYPFSRSPLEVSKVIQDEGTHLSKIIETLRNTYDVDFSLYKESTIIRRIEKRIHLTRNASVEEYITFLKENEQELSSLYNDLLIGVTRFYRDEKVFETLRDEIIPMICKQKEMGENIRIWIPGCSTGEEVYSIAILFHDHMLKNGLHYGLKIFATDIDNNSLDYASTGRYPENIVSDVPEEYMNRFFMQVDRDFQIIEQVRSSIVFARHNLLKDPPFSKLDLISCRNLLIYLNSEIQQKVVATFYATLQVKGFLLLGSSEATGSLSEYFETIRHKEKIFRKRPGKALIYNEMIVPTPSSPSLHDSIRGRNRFNQITQQPPKISELIDELLQGFLPPSVIIDDDLTIIHTIHDMSTYIQLAPGAVSLNLLKNVDRELAVILSGIIRRLKVSTDGAPIEFNSISLEAFSDVLLTIRAFRIRSTYTLISITGHTAEPESTEPYEQTVTTEQIDAAAQYRQRIDELEKELQYKNETIQATVEELETSNEELQSSNEELIASNEELQSTNEELQSVNEELFTVNGEFQIKIEELTELNSDMNNLLKNTEVGTIFLDRNLLIRKVNKKASKLTQILQRDVGRPVRHLNYDHFDPGFVGKIDEVINDLQRREFDFTDDEGVCTLVRIQPYRTAEGAVDGIIILFIDITSLRLSQQRSRQLLGRLDMAMKIGGIGWWEFDVDTGSVRTSSSKPKLLGYSEGEIGADVKDWTKLIHPDDTQQANDAMRDLIQGSSPLYEVEYRLRCKDGHYRWFRDSGTVISLTGRGTPKTVAGVVMDISEERKHVADRKKDSILLYDILSLNPIACVVLDPTGMISYANASAQSLLRITEKEIKERTFDDDRWQISDSHGKQIPPEELPFSVVMRTGKPVTNMDHRITFPDGESLRLQISGRALFSDSGESAGAVFMLSTE